MKRLELLRDEKGNPLKILLEYTPEDFFCPSCFDYNKKKYKMKRIADCFGQEAYECKHCHYPIVRDRLEQLLDKILVE